MSKIAIFGDVHSNIDALEAVLADARSADVGEYLCTGDVVGYNARPHECMERGKSLGCPVTMGNHDYYVAKDLDLADFNPHAAKVVEWTREQLTGEELSFLASLPFTHTERGMTLVHATMDNPEDFGYVFDNLQAAANFMNQRSPLCFHGHTHCPMIFEHSMRGVFRIDPLELPPGPFRLQPGRKYFINVGSVGQPRDGDPRAAYVVYDTANRTVEFRRVPYDVAAAQDKVRKAGLPERLAARLALGQ